MWVFDHTATQCTDAIAISPSSPLSAFTIFISIPIPPLSNANASQPILVHSLPTCLLPPSFLEALLSALHRQASRPGQHRK